MRHCRIEDSVWHGLITLLQVGPVSNCLARVAAGGACVKHAEDTAHIQFFPHCITLPRIKHSVQPPCPISVLLPPSTLISGAGHCTCQTQTSVVRPCMAEIPTTVHSARVAVGGPAAIWCRARSKCCDGRSKVDWRRQLAGGALNNQWMWCGCSSCNVVIHATRSGYHRAAWADDFFWGADYFNVNN
jgi:hypothetical protein